MKYKLYLSLLVFSLFSILAEAQEFDESFLKSLPDGVAEDLIDRGERKEALEESQYRRPSSFIEKPEPTSTRFGAKIFSMMQSSLMPINEPNFDSSYRLDFGDEIELQLIGQKSSIEKISIKRDGSITIKDIGNIFLAGLTLEEAVNLIKNKINQAFIGVEAYISLINVRDIQVIVAGNVYNPGSYTLNGNSNIFHALSISGGPSDIGSFRSIHLIRDNKKIETIDLYDIFIYAKSSFNTRLRSGDIVFIDPVKNIVFVAGGVVRPGEYELLDSEFLDKAINFSNGLNAYADINDIKLDRILDGVVKQIPITNLSQFKNILSINGDRIFIRNYSFRSVQINGAIVNPGTYLMNEGNTIADVIKKSGGFTKSAYPFGSVYENIETRNINQEAIDGLYDNFLETLLQLNQQTQGEQDFSSVIAIISKLKNIPASGRVVVDVTSSGIDADTTYLQNGDVISIPELKNQVYVFGEVSSDGAAVYKRSEGMGYYIERKGGLTKNAAKKSIYVLQPNGETRRVNFSKNIFQNKSVDVEIYPGSIIFVPREIDGGYSSRMAAQAYATILGNIGVSLASLSVLKGQ